MSKVDAKRRCPWCLGSDLYRRYHDEEWGVPVHDDRRLFELLILEARRRVCPGRRSSTSARATAELRALRPEEGRALFGAATRSGCSPIPASCATASRSHRRSWQRACLSAVQREFGSFDAYLLGVRGRAPTPEPPEEYSEVPARTILSDALSKDLKRRGFRFVGSTTSCTPSCRAVRHGQSLDDSELPARAARARRDQGLLQLNLEEGDDTAGDVDAA